MVWNEVSVSKSKAKRDKVWSIPPPYYSNTSTTMHVQEQLLKTLEQLTGVKVIRQNTTAN